MFWIKDPDGDLVNLAGAHCIQVLAGHSANTNSVNAYFGQHAEEGFSITLFNGTREACTSYRDNLYAHLREIQGGNHA